MSRERYGDLWALHALGALEPAESADFEAHLAGCAECRAGVEEARTVSGALALALPETAPPPALRARLLAAARAERPDRAAGAPPRAEPPRVRWLFPAALAAAAVAFAAFTVWSIFAPRPDEQPPRWVLDPLAQRWILKAGDKAVGTVWHHPHTGSIAVTAKGLEAPAAGKTFVLWTVAKDDPTHPRNVGAFRVEPGQAFDAVVSGVPSIDGLAAVAVSVETDPRVAAPTQVVAAASPPAPPQ